MSARKKAVTPAKKTIATPQRSAAPATATSRVAGVQRSLVCAWIDRYALSAAEAETLRLAVSGLRREEIARARRRSPNTIRAQSGTLLEKLCEKSLAEARAVFFRELCWLLVDTTDVDVPAFARRAMEMAE